jgi:hypothetical protein
LTRPVWRGWSQAPWQQISQWAIDQLAQVKCYTVDEFELLGVEREAGKPAFALMGEIGTRKYCRLGLHQSEPRDPRAPMETRPGARRAGAQGMKRPATQRVKPGLIGRVKHLRGEEDLRDASLQDFREE